MKINYLILLVILFLIVGIAICLTIRGCKNKPPQEQISDWLEYLESNPIPLVPYRAVRFMYLKGLAQKLGNDLTPLNTLCIGLLAGEQSADGYDQVESGPFSFPKDHGPHWNIRTGWHFYIANLWTEDQTPWVSKPITIVYVIKRRAFVPKNMWKDKNNPLPHQIAFAYGSVCDPTVGIKRGEPIVKWGTDSDVTLRGSPFLWKVGDNWFKGIGNRDSPFPMNIKYNQSGVEFDLIGIAKKNLFLQGVEGCAPCLYGLGYRYYSWPIIETTGKVLLNGEYKNVKGVSWLDHQYGSSMEPSGFFSDRCLQSTVNIEKYISPQKQLPAWNWFEVQLQNNMQFTMALGPAPDPKGGMGFKGPMKLSLASIIDEQGNKSNIPGTITYHGWELLPTGTWYATGVTMVLQWEKEITLVLTPTTMDQIGYGAEGTEYYEGGCNVNATINRETVMGVAALEMVGWESQDKSVGTLLQNAGTTVDPLSMQIFTDSSIPPDIYNQSLLVDLVQCKKK